MNRLYACLSGLAMDVLLMAPAMAQEQSTTPLSTGIDEVVVTARKMGESVLDTPATVTVVSAEALAAENITSAHEISGIVPGLVSMQGTAGTSAAFRGIGSTSADPSIESSVATFVDGVYLGHPRDYVMPLYDVEQVEFLAGTQSTLLGKNTSLGAVSITNRRPKGAFGYDGALSYSDEIEAIRFQGGMDIPLGENAGLRPAILVNDEQGFIRNEFLDRSERQIQELSGRLTFQTALGSSGDLVIVYQHDDRQTEGQPFEVLTDPNGSVEGLSQLVGQTEFDTIGDDVTWSGSDRLNPADPAVDLPFDDQKGDRANLIATFDIGTHTFTSQTAYVDWDSKRRTDLDFTSAFLIDFLDHEQNKIFSEELRINSSAGEKFTYLGGLYYYTNDWTIHRGLAADDFLGAEEGELALETEAWSAFASARYELTDRFGVSLGLRYTDEEKTPTYERVSTGAPLNEPLPRTTLDTVTNSDLDGDVGLEFRPTTNGMLYARWARGSKSGGFQTRPDTLETAGYEPEVAYTSEIGGKFEFDRGFATFAVFQTRVEDFQVSSVALVGGLNQPIITNSDVQTVGAQAGGVWSVTDNFKLTGDVLYAEAEFTEDLFSSDGQGGQTLEAYDGMVLPRAPRWTGQLGAEYVQSIGDSYSLQLEGKVRYAGEADLQLRASNPLAPKSEEHATVDLRIALVNESSGWDVSLIGTNLTDERYVTFTTDVVFDGDAYYGSLSRPRTIALQVTLFR